MAKATRATTQPYDVNAIRSSLQNLLEEFHRFLDPLYLHGIVPELMQVEPFGRYLTLAQEMEQELLLNWTLLQEQGVEALKERQQSWCLTEIRQPNGFYAKWRGFQKAVAQELHEFGVALAETPWKSLVLAKLSDASLAEDWAQEPTLVEALLKWAEADPHHQAISFLNLTEIGGHQRTELLPLTQPSLKAQGPLARWAKQPAQLVQLWKSNHGGSLGARSYFRVEVQGADFRLVAEEPKERVRFGDLFGIEAQIAALKANTQLLLAGKEALNGLLWGSRGTGKSSSVRALAEEFKAKQLKVVELAQEQLNWLPSLFRRLAARPEKFVIFVDDLSFDSQHSGYQHLKSMLDGSLAQRSNNVVILATANRKDLVFQPHLDSTLPENRQLQDEQRALDDRFGLKIYFDHPRFQELKELLWFVAKEQGLKFEPENLHLEFLRFAAKNNHDAPSGRTVRQFLRQLAK